jgi:hypothetical protein
MDKINKISNAVDTLADKVQRQEARFTTLFSRLSWVLWRIKAGHEIGQPVLKNAIKSFLRCAYDSGMLSEELLFKIFSCDEVNDGSSATDEAVRTARKALVLRIKSIMGRSDAIRSKVKKYQFLLEKVKSYSTAEMTDSDSSDTPIAENEKTEPKETPELEETAEPEEASSRFAEEMGDETEQDDLHQEQQQDLEVEAEKEEEDVHQEQEADQEEDEEQAWKRTTATLPRWRPSFHQRELDNGSLALIADLGGVDRSTVTLTRNPSDRSVTIRGVKPFQRLFGAFSHRYARQQPHGWFEESFVVPRGYSLNVKTHLDGHYLVITIPRSVPQRSQFDNHYYHRRPHFSAFDRPHRSPFDAIFGF